ncbi:MAG: bifunctional nuclease family protein [Bacillota bacterium]|nr:bifunctional nuclease family protein [Bacillota bacterium]
MVEMVVLNVGALNGEPDQHLMLLQEVKGNRLLAINIGSAEAASIALALREIEVPRPQTHDLLATLIRRLQARLIRVIIHDLRDDTFYAQLDLDTEQGVQEIDCRPSDAVALAARTGAPILVSEAVLEKAAFVAPERGQQEE